MVLHRQNWKITLKLSKNKQKDFANSKKNRTFAPDFSPWRLKQVMQIAFALRKNPFNTYIKCTQS